jgi:hypothetical protein
MPYSAFCALEFCPSTSSKKLGKRLLAYNEAWWPLQTVTFGVRAEQCVGAELKKVTAVLKAKFADHALKEIQIFESNTRRSLAV